MPSEPIHPQQAGISLPPQRPPRQVTALSSCLTCCWEYFFGPPPPAPPPKEPRVAMVELGSSNVDNTKTWPRLAPAKEHRTKPIPGQWDSESERSQEPSTPLKTRTHSEGCVREDGQHGRRSRKGSLLAAHTGKLHLGSRVIRHRRFDSQYELNQDQILGTGLSGAVRVARRRQDGSKVAVKVLSTQGLPEEKVEQLLAEVEIYLMLDHPNICRLLEVYEEGYEDHHSVYLVMELCSGKELYDRLASRRRYSERDAAEVIRQMVAAVKYCHARSICHRDLKLENFVYASMSESARLKLIDFGLSKVFSPGVPMTAITGTVYYVAPEVMTGNYGVQCDMWSIGVMAYMLLAGVPPFNGSNDREILRKIATGRFSMRGHTWEFISDAAKDFIHKLLNRNPGKRLNADMASRHEWLLRAGPGLSMQHGMDEGLDVDVLAGMQQFANANVLKRATLGVMAYSLSPTADIEELAHQFETLDRTNTGTIRASELLEVLQNHLECSPAEAEFIFSKLRGSGKEEIHYSEFLAAALGARMVLQEKHITQLFAAFDVDNSGFISVENLRSVLGDEYDGTPVEEIVSMCDRDGDGRIDWHEFEAMLVDSVVRSTQSEEEQPGSPVVTQFNIKQLAQLGRLRVVRCRKLEDPV